MPTFYESALAVALSLVAYNSLFTGVFIFFKRRDGAGLQYLISSLCIMGWSLGFSFMVSGNIPQEEAERWGRLSQLFLFLMPVAWLHFVLSYTKQSRKYLVSLIMAYLFVAVLLFSWRSHAFILSFREISDFYYYPVPGPVYKGLSVAFGVIMIFAFWVLFSFWRDETSILRRDDARFFFFSQAYGYGLASLCLVPSYGIALPQYQILALPLWQFLLAYAMIRHHLLDFDALSKTMHRDRLAALSTVTASMHHELRNPLTAIKTFAEFLPKKYDDEKFRKKFSTIVSAEIERVNDLLNQLLEFSKPSEAHWSETPIENVLEETLEFLKPRLTQDHIELKSTYGVPAVVRADPKQLKQVFLNLIFNAVQAMPEGGVLSIDTGYDKHGNYCIFIGDTGVGMTKDQVKKIMDPFFTTKEKGTGLGMSIVQHILETHHADIRVTSEQGEGTTVELIFKRGVKPV